MSSDVPAGRQLKPSQRDDAVSHALASSYDGRLPKQVSFPLAKQATWGDTHFTVVGLSISNGQVAVELAFESDIQSGRKHDNKSEQLQSQKLIISFENESRLSIDNAYSHRSSWTPTSSNRIINVYFFESGNWRFTSVNQPSGIWLSELSPDIATLGHGNLHIDVQYAQVGKTISRSASNMHIWLEGYYNYYLVNVRTGADKDKWILVTDTRKAQCSQPAFNRSEFFRDITALQFSVGRQLRLGALSSWDDSDNLVASIGVRFSDYTNPLRGEDSPIPIQFEPTWFADLFSHLVHYRMEHSGDRLHLALSYYISSISDSVESRFLKLQMSARFVSEEIAAVYGKDTAGLIRDAKRWADWIDSQSEAIEAIASDDKSELLTRALRQFSHTQLGITTGALNLVSLPLLPDIDEVVDPVDLASAVASLSNLLDKDFDSGISRLRKTRALVVALVSKLVGYGGPIQGWDYDANMRLPNPDRFWTQSKTTPSANSIHVSEDGVEHIVGADFWPAFSLPTVPKGSLLSILDAFAKSLVGKTQGLVSAKLVPQRTYSESPTRYELRLIAASSPSNHSLLFSVLQDGNALIVSGWEEELKIDSLGKLKHFMESLSKDADVIARIENLMTFSSLVSEE